MVRSITLIAALALSANSAFAEDGEIVLKVATAPSLALSLDEVAPDDDWEATPAEPMAARTKADILIESLSYPAATSSHQEPLVVSYDTALLDDAPYAVSDDGWFQIYAVDTIVVDAAEGDVDTLPGREPAQVLAPRGASFDDVAVEHAGYLLVEPDGAATLVFPVATNLMGVEPDEID